MQTTELNIETEFITIQDQLESYLYRLSANREDAKDLLQDTYLKVKQKIDTFKGQSSFKTWVFAIATNLAKDNQRVKTDGDLKCKMIARTLHYLLQNINKARSFQNQTEQQFEVAEHINYCFTCIAKNLNLEQQVAIILKEFYQFKRQER